MKKGHGHLAFNPIGGEFPEVDDFANNNYAQLRFAFEACQLDDKALEDRFAIAAPQGILPTLLESWCEQKAVLQTYIKLLDAALARSFVVLDRLGYTPEIRRPAAGLVLALWMVSPFPMQLSRLGGKQHSNTRALA